MHLSCRHVKVTVIDNIHHFYTAPVTVSRNMSMEEFVIYLKSKGLVKEEDQKKIHGMCAFLCPTWVKIYGIKFILTSLVNYR